MRNRGINAAVRLWKVQRCCGRYSYISSQLYEQSSINPHSDSCQLTSIAACTQTQLLGHLMNSITNSYDDRDDALPQYCAVSSAFTTFGCRGAELDQLPTLQDNQMPQSLLSQSMKPYCCPHSGCSSRSYRIFPIFLSCTDHSDKAPPGKPGHVRLPVLVACGATELTVTRGVVSESLLSFLARMTF